jgi:hypothetical protein
LHTVGGAHLLIDGFRFRDGLPSVWVLSHYHSDHYAGLDHEFPWDAPDDAILYCSEVTAALAVNVLGVNVEQVRALPFGRVTPLPALPGVTLCLLPSNHCVGAAMMLFTTSAGSYLHTGDFRADPSMHALPQLARLAGIGSAGVVEVLLDTTYAHSKHTFGCQAEAIETAIETVRLELAGGGAAGTGSAPLSPSPSKKRSRLVFSAPTAPPQRLVDNTRYALSVADLRMRAGSPLDDHPPAAVGGGASSQPQTGRVWVEDGPWGTGYVFFQPHSEPLPVQPPGMHPGIMACRFPGLPAPLGLADTGRTLILISTYSVGKERLLFGIARALRLRLYMTSKKMRMVELMGLARGDLAMCTDRKTEAGVHVVGMGAVGSLFPFFTPNWRGIMRYLNAVNGLEGSGAAAAVPSASAASAGDDAQEAEEAALFAATAGEDAPVPSPSAAAAPPLRFNRVVALLPTGWVTSSAKRHFVSPCGVAAVHLVPYSEHSSYEELCAFLAFLRPHKITPTVYDDEKDAARICALLGKHVNQAAAKRAFLSAFPTGGGRMQARAGGGEDEVVEETPPEAALHCHGCGLSAPQPSSREGLLACGACGSGAVERVPARAPKAAAGGGLRRFFGPQAVSR